MQSRELFIEELLTTLTKMLNDLEDREAEEPDFTTALEIVEQLYTEIEELQ